MKWLLVGLLAAVSGSAETPMETALKLNSQGNQENEAGNYAEARRLYGESLRVWRSLGPQFDGHAAGTLLNMAVAISNEGDRLAASKALEEALALHRRVLGIEHPHTIANMNLLAGSYLALGDMERGEALLQEVLPVERERFPDDIMMARTLEALSNLKIRRGQAAAALPPAEEALRISVHATGENSLDTALASACVAEAYRVMGSTDRALPLFRRARFLYQQALGPMHPRVATLLSQEGLILMHDGNLSLAEQAMTQAVDKLAKSCPGCLVERSIAENNLGLLRLKQKRYREADAALSESVELREKFSARPGPELADALESLAIVREKLRRYDDAGKLNRQAATIRAYR